MDSTPTQSHHDARTRSTRVDMADDNRWTYVQQRYLSGSGEKTKKEGSNHPQKKTMKKKKKKKENVDQHEQYEARNPAEKRPGIVLVDEDEDLKPTTRTDRNPHYAHEESVGPIETRGKWVEVNTGRFQQVAPETKRQKYHPGSKSKKTNFPSHIDESNSTHMEQATQEIPSGWNPPRRTRHDSSPDLSPPRRNRHDSSPDLSPPRRNRHDASPDLSPPRRNRHDSSPDLSPPRRNRHDSSPDLSPPRRNREERPGEDEFRRVEASAIRNAVDVHGAKTGEMHGRKMQAATGLIDGRELSHEIRSKVEKEDSIFQSMDPSVSGRGAETVYRDKQGMKLKVPEGRETSKRKIPEWGTGLVQKRMKEEQMQLLQEARAGPFARHTNTQDYDAQLRARNRWGDPLANQKDYYETIMEEMQHRMQTSERLPIPPDIPGHSWLKRKLPPPPNRYDILPGRHWDGVNRSNGFESAYFDHMAKQATRDKKAREWSTADM